jgi:hypothetical protein
VWRRENNLERMRATGHMKALARQGGAAARPRSGDESGAGPMFSPSIPRSPSPFLFTRRSEVDARRVSRKPSR